MRAIVFNRCGSANVLQLTETPIPSPKPGEVVVQVKACALNRMDLYVRSKKRSGVPMPHIPGADISGVIANMGKKVVGWKMGQAVIVCPSVSCGRCRRCRKGQDSYCESFGILGFQYQGGYAEYVAVPSRNLIPKPAKWDWVESAAIPLVFTTAWHMAFDRGKLRKGETVLVMGGSSGMGTALIQLCKTAGARVIATVGDDRKKSRLRRLGAAAVVNHSKKGWDNEINRITQGKGVELVLEHLGSDFLKKEITLLSKGGRVVTIASISGDVLTLPISSLYRRQISIIGSYMGSKKELMQAIRLIQKRKIRPVIDKVFPLEKARQAQEYLESRKNIGKVVLEL